MAFTFCFLSQIWEILNRLLSAEAAQHGWLGGRSGKVDHTLPHQAEISVKPRALELAVLRILAIVLLYLGYKMYILNMLNVYIVTVWADCNLSFAFYIYVFGNTFIHSDLHCHFSYLKLLLVIDIRDTSSDIWNKKVT